MAVPIFTTEAPYRDLHTWNVHLTKPDTDAGPAGTSFHSRSPGGAGSAPRSPLTLSKNEVWHHIVLTNTTKLPWTTGAAMIMRGNQPLARKVLSYTPKDEVRVPVTVSVDTRGSLSEKETGRDLNGLQWEGNNYARSVTEMTLDLCNQ